MILTLLAIGSALFAAGGGLELSSAKDRYRNALERYELLIHQAEERRASLDHLLSRLGDRVLSSRRLLREAQRILQPAFGPRNHNQPSLFSPETSNLSDASSAIVRHEEVLAGLSAVGAGAGVALGSWAAVSMLGLASTGTAIGTLHGVALSNATLAWFGGGSLASGGAGMAAGKVVLVKLALMPMAALYGFKWFSKAAEFKKAAEDLEAANHRNSIVLSTLDDRVKKTFPLEELLASEQQTLRDAVREAEKRLFRFGYLSRIWRRVRTVVGKAYYSDGDLLWVEDLERSVIRFFAIFQKEQTQMD